MWLSVLQLHSIYETCSAKEPLSLYQLFSQKWANLMCGILRGRKPDTFKNM